MSSKPTTDCSAMLSKPAIGCPTKTVNFSPRPDMEYYMKTIKDLMDPTVFPIKKDGVCNDVESLVQMSIDETAPPENLIPYEDKSKCSKVEMSSDKAAKLPHVEKEVPCFRTHLNDLVRCFGNQVNEIEYSANVKFTNTELRFDDPAQKKHFMKKRYYMSFPSTMFYSLKTREVAIKWFPGSTLVDVEMVMRIDDSIPLDRPNELDNIKKDDIEVDLSLRRFEAKLKVMRHQFIHNNVKFTLSGSLESPIPEMRRVFEEFGPINNCQYDRMFYSQKERFIYSWYVSFFVDGDKSTNRLAFRVALRCKEPFKYPSSGKKVYECNIECEDEKITGVVFLEAYDMISKYYRIMNEKQGYISVQMEDAEQVLGPYLNARQQMWMKTFRTSYKDCTANTQYVKSDMVPQFMLAYSRDLLMKPFQDTKSLRHMEFFYMDASIQPKH